MSEDRPTFLVYIATSLDGYIARPDGRLDWLPGAGAGSPPMPSGEDHGYDAFMTRVDTVVLGRGTFEALGGFESWDYPGKRVVVLSRTLTPEDLPAGLRARVELHSGPPEALARMLGAAGARGVYVDGGQTIQAFLRAGLIHELTVTRVPVLLGEGRPLFGPLAADVPLRHLETRSFPSGFVQSRYVPRLSASRER